MVSHLPLRERGSTRIEAPGSDSNGGARLRGSGCGKHLDAGWRRYTSPCSGRPDHVPHANRSL